MKLRIPSWLLCLAIITSALGVIAFSAAAAGAMASIAFDKEYLIIDLGKTGKIGVTATGGPVTWTSGDKSIAMVDKDGVVKAVGGGRAIITAYINDAAATCVVTVNP